MSGCAGDGHEWIVATGQAQAMFPPPRNTVTVITEYRHDGCVTWREV